MILSQVKINKFSRHKTKATLLGLCLATSLFWVSSQLPSGKAMACVPPVTIGFFCNTVNQATSDKNVSEDDAQIIQTVFLVLNFVIAGRVLWKVYQAWSGRKRDEEFQPKVIDINAQRGKS